MNLRINFNWHLQSGCQEYYEILESKTEIPAEEILKQADVYELLKPGYSKTENGFCRLDDCTMYISVLTNM